MPLIHSLVAIVGLASLAIAAGYATVVLIAVVVWRLRASRPAPPSARAGPVTILKPLCGAEPGLYEHLRSFCRQDYPEFQVVFGVSDSADPALAVVERLSGEFPLLLIDVVVNPQQHGSNRKNSNLINMLARARYDILAIADSDTWVGSDYLAIVTAPLLDQHVGLVTCLYRDVPTGRIWSHLGAMYINDWYAPSVLLAWLFGHRGYASGQTLCLRRDTLQAIGGLAATASHLADDNRLGELVRALGLRIVLSPYEVQAQHDEPDLLSLTRHELRWLRTIRALRPRSFRFIFMSFSLPLAIIGMLLASVEAPLSITSRALFGVALTARLALHFIQRFGSDRPLLSDLWLLPARDLLLCWVWCQSFFSSRVSWRGSEFDVDAQGVMRRSV